MSILESPLDRTRRRRHAQRRRRRRRRVVAASAFLVAAAGAVWGIGLIDGRDRSAEATSTQRRPSPAATTRPVATPAGRARDVDPPAEIRGIHLHMSSAPELDRFLGLRRDGLNAIELDVKDEAGRIAWPPANVPLARRIGAAHRYYKPWKVARRVHARGIYLIGRIVTFQDPPLAEARPELATQRSDGSVWRASSGHAWANPFDRRVWKYQVDVAEAAARAGFDEIQFDYVRFPSDGDVGSIVYPRGGSGPDPRVVAAFLRYASKRLRPLGVRVSAAVFGLSATMDVGVGQSPRLIAPHVDALYPMVYPSHFTPGSYGLADPNSAPGPTVAGALRDFRRELRGSGARLVPWLQDFSLGRSYSDADVLDQVAAARDAGAGGFLLWDPEGRYTEPALSPR